MNILSGFTDSPSQVSTISLPDGSYARLTLTFVPQQLGWMFDLTWGDFSLLGARLVYGENLLRQFIHRLPFGMAVITTSGLDPHHQDDLVTGDAVIVLLDSTDVATIETAQFTRDD